MPLSNTGIDVGKRGALSNSDPADTLTPVTKSDTLDVWGATYAQGTSRACRGLLVGTAGTATVVDASGATRTSIPLQAGFNPIRVKQVKNAGTAADIWALE